jgi:hypothetical protein
MRDLFPAGPQTATRVRARWRNFLPVVFALWFAMVGLGAVRLLRYSNTPWRLTSPPRQWPAGSLVHPRARRATLLLFAHPQCPCTSATIGELALVMARRRAPLDAYVLLYVPRSAGSEFTQTQTRSAAESIPGVHVIEDIEGGEIRRFGAGTSGQTLLYDAGGALQFSGGITASRGHAGGNYGSDALLSLLETGSAGRRSTPVFGCSLLGDVE